MIAIWCGIKISVVRHLVLSECTRVTDGQTDGRTNRITTPKTALAYARAVKINAYSKIKNSYEFCLEQFSVHTQCKLKIQL